MASNSPIQSLWIGNTISDMELLCMSSYLYHGHQFHLYTYDDIEGLPEGVVVKDANTIIPNNYIFIDASNGLTGFSDWFRYKLLHANGGWWVDMDTICIKHFDMEDEFVFASESNDKGDKIITNAFIKCPAESDFLADCLNFIELRGFSGVNAPTNWGEFGPRLLANVLKKYDAAAFIQSPATFCPVNFSDLHLLIGNYPLQPTTEVYAIHLWNEVWKRARLNKNASFHPESPYEVYKKMYLQ